MSPVTFHKAERTNLGLLLMIAGGTGAGKTWSAMELATGLAGGQRFGVCDTERGRASMYADTFDFDVFDLEPPFSPERYQEVVEAAEAAGLPVLVIDSMSHEWEGVGGLLDQHDQLMGGNQNKNLSAWIAPKTAHRKFVSRMLQAKPHIVMCFRAAEKVEASRNDKGKMQIVPKKSLTGLNGWLPITEKNLPFEATASFLLMADRPGVPRPIKLPDPLRTLVPLDRPLSQETGRALGEWASGKQADPDPAAEEIPGLITELLALSDELGQRDPVTAAITKNRRRHSSRLSAHVDWLRSQIARAGEKVAAQAAGPDDDLFSDDPPTTNQDD